MLEHLKGRINGASFVTPVILWEDGDAETMEWSGLVDTGAGSSYLSADQFDLLPWKTQQRLEPTNLQVQSATGAPVTVQGILKMTCMIGGRVVTHAFVVAQIIESVILGFDFLANYRAVWDWTTGGLSYQDDQGRLTTEMRGKSAGDVRLLESVELPPYTERLCLLQLTGSTRGEGNVMLDLDAKENGPMGYFSSGIAQPRNGQVRVTVRNSTADPAFLTPQDVLGVWKPLAVDTDGIMTLDENNGKPSNPRETPLAWQAEVDELLSRGDTCLSDQQKTAMGQLVMKYPGLFAAKGAPLGRTHLVEHHIDVGDARPVKQAPRRVPVHRTAVVDEALEDMVSAGVIAPSESPWSSPVVIVRKKDGSHRFCVDYRRLNSCTVKDAYPLPRIEDNLDALQGAKWFSSMDLASGYWQVAMAGEDKEKAAFATRYGLWEWNVMPFGLCNAPATFQRLMEKVLAGLQWKTAVVYLDDVIVYGRTFEEHLERLEEVFQRLQAAGLKLKPSKCQFAQREVAFLGHRVTAEGVLTDDEKVQKVLDWPVPRTVTQVKGFLGLTSYYRRYIEGYAEIARPLNELTRKEVEYLWTEDCQKAFCRLQRALTEAPVLGYPQVSGGPYILDTDASQCSIGAVLSQLQEGAERVICYGSRTLDNAEKNYCTTRRELLAIVYFVEYYRHYLLGRHFTIRTDHGSLRWLMTIKEPSGQTARWMERIAVFDFEIQHRPGVKHGNADGMSRIPCPPGCRQCDKMINEAKIRATIGTQTGIGLSAIESLNRILGEDEEVIEGVNPISPWETDNLVEVQREDPDIGMVMSWTERPVWADVSAGSKTLKFLWAQFQKLRRGERGLVWYGWTTEEGSTRWKLMVPAALRDLVLGQLHSSVGTGHFGLERSAAMIKRAPVYWVGMMRDMEEFCRNCDLCMRTKPTLQRRRAAMVSYTAGEPFQRVGVDIMGPLPETVRGNKYILVLCDYFTRWVEAFPLVNHKAETVAETLVTQVFSRFGIPHQLHSDQGRDFLSNLFRQTCTLLGIDQTRTTPWRPQSNGLVERMNRTLGAMLRQHVNENQENWDTLVELCTMAYRSSVHSVTGYTPNYLLFGRELPLPLDLVLRPPADQPDDSRTLTGYVHDLRNRLWRVHHAARRKMGTRMRHQKRMYDRQRQDVQFAVGQGVWLYNETKKVGKSPKLMIKWEGPYGITARISSILYRVQKTRRSRPRVVHVDKLRPVRGQYDGAWIKDLLQQEGRQNAEVEVAPPDDGPPLPPLAGPEPAPAETGVEAGPDRGERRQRGRPRRTRRLRRFAQRRQLPRGVTVPVELDQGTGVQTRAMRRHQMQDDGDGQRLQEMTAAGPGDE